MKDSHRVPGYSYRRSGIVNLKKFTDDNMNQYNVEGDALRGEPSRQPTSEDGRRVFGGTGKKSPLD